ncbi:MAG: AAA family ATPase [Rhodomicrobium sp.]
METRRAQTRSRKAPDGLAIQLLGEIKVQRGSTPLTLPASKRTRALLGFLVATATPQSRQTLCDLLWDGPDDPRAALRWSLTKLRSLVDDAGVKRLKADREHISFSREETLTDIGRLDELLGGGPERASLAEIEEAAALLQGEFLDGLDLPSCYRFHHWCLAERERWGSSRRRVLSLAIGQLEGDPDRALPYARAMVAADPLSEEGHGKLVVLLAALGRRKDAQDHYDYAVGMLRRETGAALLGALKAPARPRRNQEVENTIKAEPLPPQAAFFSQSTAPPANSLVGRVEEQQAIVALLDALVAGRAPKALLLTGEPGMGKSRLLDFVAEQAAQRAARVVSARCFEAEAVRPYGCWADALSSLIAESADPSARLDLAPFLPSREASVSDEGSRTRMFAAVMSLLASIASQLPLVLMIDDLQWIDEGSSSLLHYVLRTSGKPERLLFAGAARADEIDDNPWSKRVVSALTQGGNLTQIRLAPLDAGEVAQFLEPGASAGDVCSALKQSGGNPLFLTELTSAGQQGKPAAGRGLDALIGDRISRLEESERELIVFASATSRDFRPELLGAAMGVPEAQLIERIDRLERRGLLGPGGEGRFDFAHDLIRQATYRELSQPRRRLIHRQIARALGEAARNDPSLAGELAYHAGAAEDHGLAVQACVTAGQHCLRLFANEAAIDAADRGLGHLERLPPGPDRAHWHVALLNVKVFAGASPGVRVKPRLLDELRRAVEAAELMDLRDDAVLGWHMISWWAQRSNDTLGAQRAILRAEEISRPKDDFIRCNQLASTARCLLEVEGDAREALDFLHEADRLAASLNQHFIELDWGHGLLARWDGDLLAARESMRRALVLARLREDRWREIECLIWIAKIAIESGRSNDVSMICDEIDAVAARIGDGPAPVADVVRALALMLDNDEAAESRLQQKLASLRAYDDKAQLAYVLNHIAAWHLGNGELNEARTAATEALGAAHTVKRTTEIVVATCILAGTAAKSNDAVAARRIVEELPIDASNVSSLSARARFHLNGVRESLKIPTLIQTASD